MKKSRSISIRQVVINRTTNVKEEKTLHLLREKFQVRTDCTVTSVEYFFFFRLYNSFEAVIILSLRE